MTRLNILPALLAVVMVGLCSCRNEVKLASGDYTFKTSGTVTLTSSDTLETFILDDEVGTLTVLDKRDNDKGVILTFNSSYGPVVTATGRIVDNRVLVDDFTRTMEFTTFDPHILSKDLIQHTIFSDVCVKGSGERYGNTIVFTWEYSGRSTDESVALAGKDIRTVATQK